MWNGDALFSGRIDDFRIYSRGLTAAEITAFQTPLTAPQNLAATPGPLAIALTWHTVTQATSYTVKTATVSGGPYVTVVTVTVTSFTHSGLPQVVRYSIIAAQNLTGPGPDSAEVGATPESPNFTFTELLGGRLAFTGSASAIEVTMPTSVVGHTYQLQFTDDLASGLWDDVNAAQAGTGNDLTFSVPLAAGSQAFFRFVIQR